MPVFEGYQIRGGYVRYGSLADICSAKKRWVQLAMSALGQWRTHALQQSMLGLGRALTLAEKLRNVIIAARWP
jgi:hypothetical protein